MGRAGLGCWQGGLDAAGVFVGGNLGSLGCCVFLRRRGDIALAGGHIVVAGAATWV